MNSENWTELDWQKWYKDLEEQRIQKLAFENRVQQLKNKYHVDDKTALLLEKILMIETKVNELQKDMKELMRSK